MKKILIVDDSPFFRGILKETLLKESVTILPGELKVIEAEDMASTFAQLKKESPDLVLLDVVMKDSEQEGVSILRKIRELYPTQKVAMLTSVGQTNIVNKCRELGVLEYLAKPFEPLELMSLMKKYLH